MKLRKVGFKFNKKNLSIDVKKVSPFSFGLMFRSKKTNALLFEFSRDQRFALTSWFCFFPFLAVWINSRGEVQEFRVVKPFTWKIKPEKSFRKIIEIPFNIRYKKIIESLVGI